MAGMRCCDALARATPRQTKATGDQATKPRSMTRGVHGAGTLRTLYTLPYTPGYTRHRTPCRTPVVHPDRTPTTAVHPWYTPDRTPTGRTPGVHRQAVPSVHRQRLYHSVQFGTFRHKLVKTVGYPAGYWPNGTDRLRCRTLLDTVRFRIAWDILAKPVNNPAYSPRVPTDSCHSEHCCTLLKYGHY